MGPPSSDHRKSPYGLVQVDNSESPPNDKSPTSHRRNRPENPFPRLATYRNRKYASFYVGNRPLLLPGPSVAPAATPSKRRGKKSNFPFPAPFFDSPGRPTAPIATGPPPSYASFHARHFRSLSISPSGHSLAVKSAIFRKNPEKKNQKNR